MVPSLKLISSVMVGILIISSLAFVLTTNPANDVVNNSNLDRFKTNFTNHEVCLVGNSTITPIIMEKLSLSTSKIIAIDDTSLLSHIGSTTIIMIDGLWLNDQSMDDVKDAIINILFNGSTIVVLGVTVENFQVILGDVGQEVIGSSEKIVDGIVQSSMFHGIKYYPLTGQYVTYSLGGVEFPSEASYSVTLLYNWADSIEGDAIPQ